MIRAQLLSLHARRTELVLRAAGDRERVMAALDRTEAVAGWWRTATALLAEAKQHPVLVAGVGAFVVALWPRRALSWAMKAWYLRQAFRRGLVLWRRIASGSAQSHSV